MPKVNQSYLSGKKQQLVQTAISVLNTKPLYEITMRDIIKAAGISQGGVYRYFTDIDDVLVAVINAVNKNADYSSQVDAIVKHCSRPEEAVQQILAFLGNYMANCPPITGKFQFELKTLLANHPERIQKIMPRITEQNSGQYLMEQLFRIILQGIETGAFAPLISAEELLAFIGSSIDGIVENITMQNYYGVALGGGRLNPESLMDTLSKCVILLLNIQ